MKSSLLSANMTSWHISISSNAVMLMLHAFSFGYTASSDTHGWWTCNITLKYKWFGSGYRRWLHWLYSLFRCKSLCLKRCNIQLKQAIAKYIYIYIMNECTVYVSQLFYLWSGVYSRTMFIIINDATEIAGRYSTRISLFWYNPNSPISFKMSSNFMFSLV